VSETNPDVAGVTRRFTTPAASGWRRLAIVAVVTVFAGCGGSTTTTTVTAPSARVAGSSATSGADGVQAQFVRVVHDVSPAVVLIETADGLGSGVVYDDKGNVVTNDHVVAGSRSFKVTLASGERHDASLVGRYTPGDLAVIRLASGAPKPVPFGDSGALQVGQMVLALGNPLGLRSSVTDGIVSSLGRTVPEGNGAVITPAVQTSAAINPGNSGGALANLDGEVVGIPTLAAIDPQLGGSAPGIGFAIPSNTVKRIVPQLIADGKVTDSGRAFLGIEAATTSPADGVLVASVQQGGPADKAGLRKDDVITTVAGKAVHTPDELSAVLAGLKPGQAVDVDIRRADGSTTTLKVPLGEHPG
jgi:S1-C subfamily serine protease